MNSELIKVLNEIYTGYKQCNDELKKDEVQHHLGTVSRHYTEGRYSGYSNSWRLLANHARPDKFNQSPKLLIEDNIVKILNGIYAKLQREEMEAESSYISEKSTMYTEGAEVLEATWMTIAKSAGLPYVSPERIPDE